jgi:hypothetical protein
MEITFLGTDSDCEYNINFFIPLMRVLIQHSFLVAHHFLAKIISCFTRDFEINYCHRTELRNIHRHSLFPHQHDDKLHEQHNDKIIL